MFWGLIMEPQKRYTQVIKKAFHISMASLDVSNTDGEPSQIMCGYEGRNYLLCTLRKPDMLQCTLDLYFEEGTTVSFATNGKSLVHLTGYLTKDLEEEDDVSDEETVEFEVKAQKKPRSNDIETNQPSKKKAKKTEQVEEEESEDSDFDIDKLMDAEEESGEEEESGLDDDDLDSDLDEELGEEGEYDEDDDDDEDEDDEELEMPKGKVVMNGLDKKSKKQKKEAQQETPTKSDKKGKEKNQRQQTPGPKKGKENGDLAEPKQKGNKDKTPKDGQTPNSKKKTLAGGVVVEDLREGQGDAASNGKFVHVYYEGRLKSNNKVFDKTQNGPGFGFRLGKGEVIKGWDIGVSGMKVGGKRRITCPPNLAYGNKGSPPVIPPNSTLVFEVELKKIK